MNPWWGLENEVCPILTDGMNYVCVGVWVCGCVCVCVLARV